MSVGNPNSGGGNYPPADLRGQGGWNRDGYVEKLNESEARAKYADATDKEEAGLTKPGPLERFKRWFSARF
jgi:hypothetical protein